MNSSIASVAQQYPAPYRQSIIRAAKDRKVDPRFILALMRIESVFKPTAKSPAGARGLLQFTMDTALKYAPAVGLSNLRESQLYQPETSILLGAEYLEHLSEMFPQSLEPVAASYNGGEDNVARWLKRAKEKIPESSLQRLASMKQKPTCRKSWQATGYIDSSTPRFDSTIVL